MRACVSGFAALFLAAGLTSSAVGATFPVSLASKDGSQIDGPSRRAAVSDGAGGMFVVWQTLVAECSGVACEDTSQISIQHITSSFVPAPGWPAGGIPVCAHPASQTQAVLAPDGAGGVLVAWRDSRAPKPRIYCQRVDAAGNRAAGWPDTGVQLSGQLNFDRDPVISSDGSGGAFVVWTDQSASTLFAQHVDGVGQIVSGWPAAGLTICQAPGSNDHFDMCADLSGGFYAAWEDKRAGGSQPDLYALHVTSGGTLAPGWTTNGKAVSTDFGWQRLPQVCTDGSGGVIVTWMDERNDPNDIYAQRLLADGSVAAGWIAGGTPICAAAGSQWNPAIVSDENGGAIVAWYDHRDTDIATYAIRVTGAGAVAAGWPSNGAQVSVGATNTYTTVVPDGEQGAIVSWLTNTQVHAQRLTSGGAVAPGWPAGGVLVDGQGYDGGQVNPVGVVADADGGAFFVWGRSGDIVGSHLAGDGSVVVTDVPATAASLSGIQLAAPGPNPTSGPLHVTFSLPERAPAIVSWIDLLGRVVWRNEFPAGQPGVPQTVSMDPGRVIPGLYWLKVVQGAHAASKPFVVVR